MAEAAPAAAPQALQPGAFPGVARSVYESWPAVNQSKLKRVLDRSLAHAYYEMLHPEPSTEAQELGEAMHKVILEPRIFEEDYRKLPKMDRRTKEGKAAWAMWEAENQGKIGVKPDDYEVLGGMVNSVWKGPNTLARELLTAKGANELALLWADPSHAGEGAPLLCKGLVDRFAALGTQPYVIDVKTALNASPSGFAAAVARYRYHMQAAWYLDGMNELRPRERKFVFLVVEKEPPYPVVLYELEPAALAEGRSQYELAFAKWKQAEETKTWPAYPLEITDLQLPKWAYGPMPGGDWL